MLQLTYTIGILMIFLANFPIFSQQMTIHQRVDDTKKIDKYDVNTIDSITFSPCDSSKRSCCSYALYITNNESSTLFKKIKISPLGNTQIQDVSSDEDLWVQSNGFNNSYFEFTDILNGTIPLIPEQEENIWFSIVQGTSSNPQIKVDWLNTSGVTITSQIINLPCYQESMIEDSTIDWDSFTKILDGSQYSVFSGIDQVPCANPLYKTQKIADHCAHITGIKSSNSLYQTVLTVYMDKNYAHYEWFVDGNSAGNNNTLVIDPANNNFYDVELVLYTMLKKKDGTDSVLVEVCREEERFNMNHPDPCLFTSIQTQPPCPNFKILLAHANIFNQNLSFDWKVKKNGSIIASATDNPSPITITTPGTYDITLELTAEWGAKYSCTKQMELTYNCLPRIDWSYTWCDDDKIDRNKKYQVLVTFINQSDGGVCPTYEIDLGGGFVPFNNNDLTHTFEGKPGTSFPIKFRMFNNNPSPAVCGTVGYNVIIEPLRVDFTGIVCGNGDIIVSTNSPNPEWNFPGANPDISYGIPINYTLVNKHANPARPNYNDGEHTIFLTSYNSTTHAYCQISKTFITVDKCCDKQTKVEKRDKVINNKEYRMRCKFKVKYKESFNKTKVVSKTIAFKKNKKKNSLFKWKRFRPSQIRAAVYGDFYNDGTNGCKCDNLNHYEDSDPDWDWWIRGVRFRGVIKNGGVNYLRWNSASSVHTIRVDGQDWVERIYLGQEDCSQ